MPLTTITKVKASLLDATTFVLGSLSDVDLTVRPTTGQTIIWNGTKFVAGASFSTSDFNTAFAAKSTSNLSEGTRLYYTDARARAAVSASGSINYNSSTGVFTYTQGNTDTVSEGTTNKYYTDTRARNSLVAGTGVTYTSSSGTIAIGQDIATSATPTFSGLTVTGNFTVTGTTTTVNSTNLEVTDSIIYIAKGNSANANDIGLVGHFNNGTYQHTGLIRDASDGKWKLFSNVTTEPSDTIDFTSATYDTLKVGTIETGAITGATTDALTEGTTNKYYTDTRARSALSAGSNITYSSVSGVISLTSGNVTGALGFTPYNATNPNGYTTNVGTVTSVGGTGTVNGLTLTGTVTTSGSLTLGGTLNLSSPPAIGNTAANTGAFTTLALTGAISRTMTADGLAMEVKSSYTGNPTIVSFGQTSSDGYLSIKDASGNETLLSGYNSGTSKFASKLRANNVIEKLVSTLSGVETQVLRLDDGAGNYVGRIATYNDGGYYQDLRIYTTDAAGNNEKMAAVLSGKTRSLQTMGQQYATWTESVQTIDGGVQTVRVLEDCFGRWVLVGRFAADASTAISSVISTVRGLTTATDQNTTAFSADFGSSYPSEVRIIGATDWTKWKDTRTIDWVYKVPSGRTWGTFFNGGSTTMDVAFSNPAGGTRFGFNVAGAYDGFGRWNNPNMTTMGMSDTATTNPSSAYSTPTASAINWYSSGSDAKLSVTHTGAYGGQDYNATASFGYDDGGNNFFDAFPSQYSNHTGPKMFTSAVWVLIKLN